jgi:hypothetical protein
MKKIIILSTTFFAVICVQAFETARFETLGKKQSFFKPKLEEPKNYEYIIYPLSFIVSGIEVGGEIVAGQPNRTVRVSAGYFFSNKANSYNTFGNSFTFNEEVTYSEMEGFRGEIQYRFYARDFHAPDNYFLTIFGVFKQVSMIGDISNNSGGWGNPIDREIRNLNSSAITLGFALGYRIRIQDFLSADFHFGGGFTPTSIGDVDYTHIDQVNPYRKSINLKAGITFGLRI